MTNDTLFARSIPRPVTDPDPAKCAQFAASGESPIKVQCPACGAKPEVSCSTKVGTFTVFNGTSFHVSRAAALASAAAEAEARSVLDHQRELGMGLNEVDLNEAVTIGRVAVEPPTVVDEMLAEEQRMAEVKSVVSRQIHVAEAMRPQRDADRLAEIARRVAARKALPAAPVKPAVEQPKPAGPQG
jgi:hypothetical protein